ncbi:probable disease resistance protein RXW24L [Solanum dulcamara]|uniref:probable disease resistance protein RXW24L n=1 Tax=Solanum dulcamara TaxID=45834 RepID=UPI00248595D2|nr:probable disease resistance protein RXW24L [Solanum dulcamara]
MSEIVLRSAVERLRSLQLDETAPLNESAKGYLKVILTKLQSMYVLLKGKNRVNEIEKRVRQIEQLNYQIEDEIESSKRWEWEETNFLKMLWIMKRLSFSIQKIKSKMETIIKQIEDIAIETGNRSPAPLSQQLPDHLQPCFIYLGHFLEDQSIDPEKLSHLWIIEGLLWRGQRANEESMNDMIERYLIDLAREGMVELQEEEVPATKKFKACRFVQGMKNLCISNCEEKCFLKIIDLRQEDCSLSSTSDGPYRLVIYLGNHNVDIPTKLAKTIRSLRVALHRNQHELVAPTKMLTYKDFKLLRVVDFDGINFPRPKLVEDIFNLEFLRYLSFKGCVLEELPSSISKLSNLQVLDLRVEGVGEIKITNVLWKMRRLNHLYLPLKFATQNGEKLQLYSLTELKTLVNFNTRLCRANDVLTLNKLRYLEAKVEENFSDFESITSYMTTSTSNKCPLQCCIDVIDLDCYAEEMNTVLLEFFRCKVLRTLKFKGHIGHLPPCDNISQNLSQLVLNKSCLGVDPMPILEKLPSLGILILSDNAYMGKKMVCSAKGFPQLKCLRLLNLSELKRVEVDNTAMPILSNVEINNCQQLDINNIPMRLRSAA